MQSCDWGSMVEKEEKRDERKMKLVDLIVEIYFFYMLFLFKDIIVNFIEFIVYYCTL